MSAAPPVSTAELTADSLRTIGMLVLMYVQLELAMRRFIEVLVYPTGIPDPDAFMTAHRYRRPMRTLKILVLARYANEPLKLRKFRRWHNRFNKLHGRRNTVIHGSWIDEQGTLRFFRLPRGLVGQAVEVYGRLSGELLARDMQLLDMDIATIKAWIDAYEPQPFTLAARHPSGGPQGGSPGHAPLRVFAHRVENLAPIV
jgi:hypothetical protein